MVSQTCLILSEDRKEWITRKTHTFEGAFCVHCHMWKGSLMEKVWLDMAKPKPEPMSEEVKAKLKARNQEAAKRKKELYPSKRRRGAGMKGS